MNFQFFLAFLWLGIAVGLAVLAAYCGAPVLILSVIAYAVAGANYAEGHRRRFRSEWSPYNFLLQQAKRPKNYQVGDWTEPRRNRRLKSTNTNGVTKNNELI